MTPFELPPRLAEIQKQEAQPAGQQVSIDVDHWELPDPAADVSGPAWLRLFVGQDNRAELEACGCPGSPTGGMARRAGFARQLRETLPDALLIEGPTALSRAVLGFETVRGVHRARARMVLKALAASQPNAFFPGQADFAVLAPEELARAAEAHGLPLVATNLQESAYEEGFQRSWLVEVGGRRVLFVGLIATAAIEERVQLVPLLDAVTATRNAIQEAEQRGAVDLVVAVTDARLRDLGRWKAAGLPVDLLFTGPIPGEKAVHVPSDHWQAVRADPLGRAFRRVDIAFASAGPDADAERLSLVPAQSELTPVAAAEGLYLRQRFHLEHLNRELEGRNGRLREVVGMDGVSRVDPRSDPSAVRRGLADARRLRAEALAEIKGSNHRVHKMAVSTVVIWPEIPEVSEVVDQLNEFSASRLASLAAAQPPEEAVGVGERYGGRRACTECHGVLDAHWTQTAHARAWKGLVDRGESDNPDCLPCHTTGFGAPGGFVDPTSDRSLLNVQCEACHGPMAEHAELARRQGARPQVGSKVSETTCLRCHDAANSPRFDPASYFEKVRHPGL